MPRGAAMCGDVRRIIRARSASPSTVRKVGRSARCNEHKNAEWICELEHKNAELETRTCLSRLALRLHVGDSTTIALWSTATLHAEPSPMYLALTFLPPNPLATILCSSPGKRSTA